jgi:hypothetical protein
MRVLRNPDHVTIAVENAAAAIQFFEVLGFRKQHVAVIDGGPPARYMGMLRSVCRRRAICDFPRNARRALLRTLWR